MSQADPFEPRYPFLKARQGVWREIAVYVAKDAPDVEVLVELGAGYCDFINNFSASTRIALELNAAMEKHAAPGVDFRATDALVGLRALRSGTVDLVFASNFFEHVSEGYLTELLSQIDRVLTRAGRLILIQPNWRYCAPSYFDDETHVTIFSDESLGRLLLCHGFRLERVEPRLLPFSMKSVGPKWPLLVRAYLHSPIRPMAAQMYIVASRGGLRYLEG